MHKTQWFMVSVSRFGLFILFATVGKRFFADPVSTN